MVISHRKSKTTIVTTLKNLFIVSIAILLIAGCSDVKPLTVSDIENNNYSAVTIGTQIWMSENLRTTKYNDGTPIPNVAVDSTWKELKTDAYCWFSNDTTFKSSHGALYNWYTVNTKKLCPTGWHVPSDKEWRTLTSFLGDENVAGSQMKSSSGWKNGNGTNTSGFSGLPYGFRSAKGAFSSHGLAGYFWSSTESDPNSWYCVLFSKDGTAYKYPGGKQSGFSVRCLKN